MWSAAPEEHFPGRSWDQTNIYERFHCNPLPGLGCKSEEFARSPNMYPDVMVIPMREELTRVGVKELRTPEEVDRAIANQPGTAMVVVNSICGCAAGRMRPAVRMALQHTTR